MTRTRRIALAFILLCSGLSLLWAYFLEPALPGGMFDFKGVFYGERALLQHGDPYKAGEPLRVYLAEGGVLPQSLDGLVQNLTWYIYPPTTFILIAPFAMLPWAPAHWLWMILVAGLLSLAAFLMWSLGADYAPIISCVLICIVLANSVTLLAIGNPAGIVISLCLLAVWCFLRGRFAWAGVLCLAISLAMKPHDAGLVWLYFLLAGGVYRKRALQTLLITLVLGCAAILWITPIAPHWIAELHSNLQAAEAPGGNGNPGPTNPIYRSNSVMIIDLQSAISAFRDDPRIYNPVSYLVCGALLLVWSVRTLRLRFSPAKAWLALAAIVPLTLLVTYHRPSDAKLLLLTVPACAMLWARGGPIAWLASLLNTAGVVFTGDVPLTILAILTKNLPMDTTGFSGLIRTGVLLRPTPFILLAMGIFYLWVYMRHDPAQPSLAEPGGPGKTPRRAVLQLL
jgi:hypothetical protein